RTWKATDACGLMTTCVQTIEVVDTVFPTIHCPDDLVLQCPADTEPMATGSATGSDTCGAVEITHSDEVIAHCGNTKTIHRTWKRSEERRVGTTCMQSIEVVDTVFQTIHCQDDLVLQCPADTEPIANGSATGS